MSEITPRDAIRDIAAIRKAYAELPDAAWFKKVYGGKSLGEVIKIEGGDSTERDRSSKSGYRESPDVEQGESTTERGGSRPSDEKSTGGPSTLEGAALVGSPYTHREDGTLVYCSTCRAMTHLDGSCPKGCGPTLADRLEEWAVSYDSLGEGRVNRERASLLRKAAAALRSQLHDTLETGE